jgi:cytochrome b561
MTRSSPEEGRNRYTLVQKVLHWLVAGLLLIQWLTADAYHRTHGSLLPPRTADLIEYAAHRYVGMALGVAIVLMLLARLRLGTPASEDALWRRWLAKAVHWSLYLVLVLQAATGLAGVYVWPGVARWHSSLWSALLALLLLHLAGVLFHVIRRDGVAGEMMPGLWKGRAKTTI